MGVGNCMVVPSTAFQVDSNARLVVACMQVHLQVNLYLLLLYLAQRNTSHLLVPSCTRYFLELHTMVCNAVLTSDGCISFVDVTACCFSAQLQLTFPGCRATNFSTDLRANSMAVVCTDGLVRLYDLGVVRAKQQGVSLNPQLQKLQESQLSQLSATSEALPVPAPAASGVQHIGAVASSSGGATAPAAGQQQQAGRRELGDVGNIPSSSQAGARSKGGRGGSSNVKPGSTTAEQLTVRQLAAPAAALNRRKLQEMLLMFGEFPARYRRLIW